MTWIRTIAANEATGALAETYARMRARPMPKVYQLPDQRVPGIIKAHSLDPTLMGLVFGGMSASLATDSLAWPLRELVNTATSLTNQCLY